MSWDTELQSCTWRDVTFQVERVSDSLRRRWARYEYPYRDGADIEDLGREPRPTNFTAVFLGPEYMSDLGDLMRAVDSGKSGTFTHPLLGSWAARVNISNINHESEARDMCMVELEVLEDGTDAELEPVFSAATLSAAVGTASAALATELAAATQVSGWEQVATAVSEAQSRAAEVQAAVTSSVAEIDRKMQAARQAARDVIRKAQAVYPPNVAGKLVKRAQALGYQAYRLAESAKLGKPRVRQHTQRVEGTAVLAAFSKSKAASPDDMLRLNRIRNPNRIAAGDVFAAYEPEATDA